MVKKTIFFAYEDRHQENQDAISKAAQDYNAHQKTYKVLRWEELRNSGNIIGSRISEEIEQSEIFACDLTYLNHNVLFELGYAIANKKKLKIFLNNTIANAKKNYSELKILRNVAYTAFSSAKEIQTEFQQNIHGKSLLIKDIIPGSEDAKIETDIFLINIKNKNQAANELEEYLASLDNKSYISNNEDEIPYQTLIWYLTSIIKSNIVILHMVGKDKVDYEATNAEYSLYAGIALGLKKKLLLLAPAPFLAPIDYTDILVDYTSADDCMRKTKRWLDNCFLELSKSNSQAFRQNAVKEDEQELNLLKLGIGVGVAENEALSNQENFVEIDAYNESLNPNRKNVIVVGRKGSGKTEIFLRLKERFVSGRDCFLVIIKPDTNEILGNIELTNLYNNERTKRAFFATVWKYVIFSKLFQEMIDNIGALNLQENEKNNIQNYYQENLRMFDNNFYGMVVYISDQFKDENITQNLSLLDRINEKIRPMIDIVIRLV
jgi:nucleoside 2-deoxyribosyltransferase